MLKFVTKTTLLGAALVAVLAIQGYGLISLRGTMADRIDELERRIQDVRAEDKSRTAQVSSDLDVVAKKMGVTTQELQEARLSAEQYKREQARTAELLRNQLNSKADSNAVNQFRHEASTRLEEVKQDATSKFGVVSGEVQTVRVDLDATRNQLQASQRDIDSVRTEIARNTTELNELRRRGERDYFEFDVRKKKEFDRVAGIQVQLKKADTKRQRFDIVMQIDDAKVERKERPVNEPIQFLVGRDRLRYEFVVNYVDKDRIRGYVSAPKDKVLAAEGPVLRR